MEQWYKEDLAYIHDVGHSDYALKSASGILAILVQQAIRQGLVVDLGCGSGLSSIRANKGGLLANTTKGFTEGKDWLVLVEKQEDQEQAILTRRITTFRKVGKHYRRDDEIHHLQLYTATELVEALRRVGFQVQTMHRYGQYELPKAHTAFVASKPR